MIAPNNIRNFSIIAHIDHGKTTLTDVLLRLTNTVSDLQYIERIMDSNPIEKEKGVTIKLAPVRMEYQYHDQTYILNLIDTPGHVDFGYEVSRSLAACEGAILLIDASQGIQAQTLAHFTKAKELNLKIIPVINKIDLPSVDIDQVMLECMELLGIGEDEIIKVSAKTGLNVEEILKAVVIKIPPPTYQAKALTANQDLKALIFTSVFDNHQGAIAYIKIISGTLSKQSLYLMATKTSFNPIEIGVFKPKRVETKVLYPGEVGYVSTGLKNISLLKIGDTVIETKNKDVITPLPGFKEPTLMVFMELYPIDTNYFTALKDAMGKLALHDSSLKYTGTHSLALGNGLRVGFLGIFHAEVIRERLQREFDLTLIATAPSVSYHVLTTAGEWIVANTPSELPPTENISAIHEPITRTVIFAPQQYFSAIIKLVRERRGVLINTTHTGNRQRFEYHVPLAELITDFHDQLKSISSGYASMEYEIIDYQPIDAIKVNILVNHEVIEALSFIAVRNAAETKGHTLVTKLKEVVPRQMFEVPIQAAIGGKIIARETIKAWRKDVTAKLYGGDRTRRMKLLKKQAEGKKRMKKVGTIELNQEAFLAVLSN